MFQFILLQQPTPDGARAWTMFFPIAIFAVIYFFLIRPAQVRQQRAQQKFIDSLREGMEVVTSAGIIGKVTRIDGDVVRLLIDEKTYMRVLKQTISSEHKA